MRRFDLNRRRGSSVAVAKPGCDLFLTAGDRSRHCFRLRLALLAVVMPEGDHPTHDGGGRQERGQGCLGQAGNW